MRINWLVLERYHPRFTRLLEDLKHPGLSNLEAFSLGAGGYLVTTEVLGGTTLEGVVVGGVTFLVTKGGSKLIRWVF